jgi:Flp pilus assembly protein TadB
VIAPSAGGLLAGLLCCGIGCGLVLLAVAVRGVPPRDAARPPGRARRGWAALRSPRLSGRIGAAAGVGVLALVLTRWPVAGIGTAALIGFWPALFGGARLEQQQILRLEALVMWTESLRDTISARASLEQAIGSTAYGAPAPIRPALVRLQGLVRARVPLDRALLALAAELQDPSADKVIGSLILNARQRGTGLAAVLSALTRSARDELDQRRRITAGRASMRRSVQIVVLITIGFAVFLTVFSRAYVAPYGTAGGQLALCVIIGMFAAGFAWMRRLASGEPARPFLTRPDARIEDADLRVVAHLTGLDAAQAQELAANRPGREPSR